VCLTWPLSTKIALAINFFFKKSNGRGRQLPQTHGVGSGHPAMMNPGFSQTWDIFL
jgi:hypothetical protein